MERDLKGKQDQIRDNLRPRRRLFGNEDLYENWYSRHIADSAFKEPEDPPGGTHVMDHLVRDLPKEPEEDINIFSHWFED